MFPFTGLRLLLPAIMPSWRFFDAVTASPRVDYALRAAPQGPAGDWREFRPRPAILGFPEMLRRLLWNAQGNENLFLVSLSERIMRAPTLEAAAADERELLLRVARHLDREHDGDASAFLQIRLRLVTRAGPDRAATSEIVHISRVHPMAGLLRR